MLNMRSALFLALVNVLFFVAVQTKEPPARGKLEVHLSMYVCVET